MEEGSSGSDDMYYVSLFDLDMLRRCNLDSMFKDKKITIEVDVQKADEKVLVRIVNSFCCIYDLFILHYIILYYIILTMNAYLINVIMKIYRTVYIHIYFTLFLSSLIYPKLYQII